MWTLEVPYPFHNNAHWNQDSTPTSILLTSPVSQAKQRPPLLPRHQNLASQTHHPRHLRPRPRPRCPRQHLVSFFLDGHKSEIEYGSINTDGGTRRQNRCLQARGDGHRWVSSGVVCRRVDCEAVVREVKFGMLILLGERVRTDGTQQ